MKPPRKLTRTMRSVVRTGQEIKHGTLDDEKANSMNDKHFFQKDFVVCRVTTF